MSDVDVSPGSWLNLEDLFVYNGVEFWGGVDYPDIPTSTDDQYIQLTAIQAKRLDLIAYDQYGDSELYWVIMLANQMPNGDPYLLPNQFVSGQVIRIPAIATVQAILATSTANQEAG